MGLPRLPAPCPYHLLLTHPPSPLLPPPTSFNGSRSHQDHWLSSFLVIVLFAFSPPRLNASLASPHQVYPARALDPAYSEAMASPSQVHLACARDIALVLLFKCSTIVKGRDLPRHVLGTQALQVNQVQ